MTRRGAEDADRFVLHDMKDKNWEFAVATRTPSKEMIQDPDNSAFNRESYVMTGAPPAGDSTSFKCYAGDYAGDYAGA